MLILAIGFLLQIEADISQVLNVGKALLQVLSQLNPHRIPAYQHYGPTINRQESGGWRVQ